MAMGLVKVLLFIVLLLGLVLILGYHKLTFGFLIVDDPAGRKDSSLRLEDTSVFFNFRRGGFTPPSPSKHADHNNEVNHSKETHEANEDIFNRTAEAENQDVVFFNRVPKTGSEMFQEFTKVMANTHDYHAYIDPSPMTFFPGDKYETEFMRKFNQNINGSGVYLRHITFMNFTEHGMQRPIFLSMVRHPIERVVSWYYYQRWRNRPDEKQDPQICEKSFEWKRFCEQFALIRFHEILKPKTWFDMDFDTCVLSNQPECNFQQGQGGWKDWSERKDPLTGEISYVPSGAIFQDHRNQIVFFCGNNPDCISFNSKTALNIAKQNVEQFYSVVGVLEQLDKSIDIIEAYIPKFYKSAKKIFQAQNSSKEKGVTNTNKNPNKKKLSDKVRKLMEKHFDQEIEFYEFCLQRLDRQWRNLKSVVEDDEIEWQDHLSDSEKNFADDYVLL